MVRELNRLSNWRSLFMHYSCIPIPVRNRKECTDSLWLMTIRVYQDPLGVTGTFKHRDPVKLYLIKCSEPLYFNEDKPTEPASKLSHINFQSITQDNGCGYEWTGSENPVYG